ncbi:MAG TPA: metalloregulator ArsR/SmtB family transcription factor [Anaeromyxobacter sp.]
MDQMPAAAAQARRVDALRGWMEQLADPTRLRTLRALEKQELSVLELREVLALPQSTVSRHLKVLAEAGWLASRRERNQSRYGWADGIDAGARRLWLLARAETDGWAVLRQDAERLAAVKARRDGAQRFFAGAAGAWDRLRAEVYGAALGTEALLSLLPSEWTVADLGCGTGAVAADLAPRFRKVVAVDQSGEMLRAARRRLAGLSNVELHEARLEALPLADASCDAVLAVLVLSYLEDPGAALREAERVLRPGGRLVVVEAARHADEALRRRMGQRIPGFEASALAALLPGGLVDRTARALPPEPGAKGPGLVVATARRKSR